MTIPHSLPPGSTQDPDRPHVFWYPSGERHEVRFVVAPDANLERLTTAMRHIRQLAHDADALASVDPAAILAVIDILACDALAGAEPEPRGVTVEAMAI